MIIFLIKLKIQLNNLYIWRKQKLNVHEKLPFLGQTIKNIIFHSKNRF